VNLRLNLRVACVSLARRWADKTLRDDMDRYDTENMELATELLDAREELESQDAGLAEQDKLIRKLRDENYALHERCADLTDRVEAYERRDATDKRRPPYLTPTVVTLDVHPDPAVQP
jgi:predicted nuclease with TOPRIM domain